MPFKNNGTKRITRMNEQSFTISALQPSIFEIFKLYLYQILLRFQ